MPEVESIDRLGGWERSFEYGVAITLLLLRHNVPSQKLPQPLASRNPSVRRTALDLAARRSRACKADSDPSLRSFDRLRSSRLPPSAALSLGQIIP
ncbi:MAG: hypothetical protein AMXMBFR58_18410 [Phycisphaerae bacterium]